MNTVTETPRYTTVSRSSSPYFYKDSPEQCCKFCLFDDSFAKIDTTGKCEYCYLHGDMEKAGMGSWEVQLKKIQRGRGKYNCLIGISGGSDSSTLLWMAVKQWQLNPLVIHFNNGWNSPQAESNMTALCYELGVERIVYYPNQKEYNLLNEAVLEAGVIEADLANDIYMAKLMYEVCDQYKIKYVLNGHSPQTEGSTPVLWTRMDSKYLNDIFYQYTGTPLQDYKLLSIWDQIWYGLKGIKQVRPFWFYTVAKERNYAESDMRETIGFLDYGGKHAENIYTEWIGSYVLPKKFGVDKRIVYLSAQVRSGLIDRETALKALREEVKFDLRKIPASVREHLTPVVRDRNEFARYDFKKMKPAMWLLMKAGIFPLTAYKKYCR